MAVSIPIFTAQLTKARQATNQANARAARAGAVVAYLELEAQPDENTIYVYTNSDGTVETATAALATDTVSAGDAGDQTKFDGTKVYKKVSATLNKDGEVQSYGFGD